MKNAEHGLVKTGWTTKEVGFCLQNFLCIIEMFFIAIGMHFAFHYTGAFRSSRDAAVCSYRTIFASGFNRMGQ